MVGASPDPSVSVSCNEDCAFAKFGFENPGLREIAGDNLLHLSVESRLQLLSEFFAEELQLSMKIVYPTVPP